MNTGIPYTIFINGPYDSFFVGIEFPRKNLNKIRRVIRAFFKHKFPVEQFEGDMCRIVIKIGEKCPSAELQSLYDNFHRFAQSQGL